MEIEQPQRNELTYVNVHHGAQVPLSSERAGRTDQVLARNRDGPAWSTAVAGACSASLRKHYASPRALCVELRNKPKVAPPQAVLRPDDGRTRTSSSRSRVPPAMELLVARDPEEAAKTNETA
jgi:hypothetical protein